MKKILQGLAISLITTILSLVAIEIGLRIAGSFYHKKLGAAKAANDSSFRVYCFGDSFTYGIGSENKKGYPEQLQELCDKKYPGKNIKIVNFGIPGSNSRQAFNYFKHVLTSGDYARPNAVILMTGMNDWWNIADNNEVFLRSRPNPFLGKCYMMLTHSRVFKLLTIRLHHHKPLNKPLTEADFNSRTVIADADDLAARGRLGNKFLATLRVVFEQNVNDFINLAESSGTEVLFSQYPGGSFFDPSLKRIAKTKNITTVYNKEEFKGLLSDDQRKEYFSASCSYSHPNNKGYALMAEETLATLERKLKWK